MQARQGDIFFESATPPDLKNPENKKLQSPTLAHGEVTGHSHTITSPKLSDPGVETVVDTNGDIYIRSANQDFQIEHEEHGTITLPKGEWFMVTRQREYDPASAEMERIVQD